MRPKKSLGQNFLTSTAAREAIIRAANLSPTTEDSLPYILEIGPGKGFLTEALLEAVGKEGKVIAVEKDDYLIEELAAKFQAFIKSGQLELIHGDILDLITRGGGQASAPWGKNYKLAANIPYNITGEIIRAFLETENQPQMMVLMLQKEVAERIVAKNNKESILSISVKAYGEPKYIQTVKAGSFFPKPKVDSAILAIRNISKDNFKGLSEEKFFTIVKKGFAHKRKLLRGNLACSSEVLERGKINPKARAEELTLDQWLYLSKNL